MKSEYSIYKGEDIIATGTAEELAQKMKVRRDTIYYYSSPANKRKDKGNRLVAIKIN